MDPMTTGWTAEHTRIVDEILVRPTGRALNVWEHGLLRVAGREMPLTAEQRQTIAAVLRAQPEALCPGCNQARAVWDDEGRLVCPQCGHVHIWEVAPRVLAGMGT